jgi:putative hydrolase of the HAD superfamily
MNRIRNIIFDIGNVLIRFEPLSWLIRTYGEDFETIKVLYQEVFGSEEWKKLDEGILTPEEAVASISKRIPGYSSHVERIILHWENFLIEEMTVSVYFLKKLKEKGYGIYALSNYPERGFLNTEKYYPFFNLFDGKVVSYEVNEMKPGKRIYEILMERYGLFPEECLFIDDTLPNIRTARDLGMTGVHFTHSNQLMEIYLSLDEV